MSDKFLKSYSSRRTIDINDIDGLVSALRDKLDSNQAADFVGRSETTLTGYTSIHSADFHGSATNLTDIQVSASEIQGVIENTQLRNDSITLGSSTVELGSSLLTIGGLTTITSGAINATTCNATIVDCSTLDVVTLNAVALNGSGLGITALSTASLNTAVPNSQLANDSVTVGTTEIALGGSSTTLGGLTAISAITCTANVFNGSGAGLTEESVPNSALANAGSVTLGSNAVSLGSTLAVLSDMDSIGVGKAPFYKLDVQVASNSFQIVEQLTNSNAGIGSANLAFNVTAGGEASVPKASIGMIRHSGQGVGDMIFCMDASMDTNAVSATDEVMRLKNTGYLGIGTSFPSRYLHVEGDLYCSGEVDIGVNHPTGTPNGEAYFTSWFNSTEIGTISQLTTSSVAYNTTSDYRLKENIVEMPSMLNKIASLNPVQFNYLEDTQDSLGFLAHEVQELFQTNALVTGEKDAMQERCGMCTHDPDHCVCEDGCTTTSVPKYQAMDYGKLTPICLKAIQELLQIVEDQSTQIGDLVDRITVLEG